MNQRPLTVLLLSILLISAQALSHAAPPISQPDHPQTSSVPYSTLVEATVAEPETLDPALDYETMGAHVLEQIYDPLIGFDREKTDEFIPMLATGWTISPDGLTYTFDIRQGVRFHNGNSLTSDDVAYTFRRGLL
jgi:peptide/nickel transport system substrate-binding protein